MAEAIVSIVSGRLSDLLIEEAQPLEGVKDEIELVVTELRRMSTFLRDADSRISEYEIRILVADLRKLAYDAEHVIESFLLKALSTRRKQAIKKCKKEMKDVQKQMVRFFDCFRDYKIKSTLESPGSSSSWNGIPGKLKRFYTYPVMEPEIFVGFQGVVDRIVGHLVNESDDCYPLISICGMGGLGKTTLAQKIYNHDTIKNHFAGLAWVTVSQKWHTKHVLKGILICLIPDKEDEIIAMDEGELVENLIQVQSRKKCLIVLDDIWSTDAWDSLSVAFKPENAVSKLMLTSRNVDVAKHVNPKGFIHQPETLTAEQSWELLQFKALPKKDDLDVARDDKRMEELGREMVQNCAGLPLAIVILGGILVTKPSLWEWEKVYFDSLLSLRRGKGLKEDYQSELLDVLVWSYNDLPPQLKPCFLYLGKYGEDEWIETETLYQLWIAEGMVLSSDKREGETMMQVAESYMGELVHRSMVQVRHNDEEPLHTKFKYCFLHDLMRDLSLSRAKLENFFEVIDFREGNDTHLNPFVDSSPVYTRQLVVYFDERNTSKKDNSYFVQKACQQRYLSMLIFSKFATSLPPVLGSHFAKFRFLRVFALEKVQLDRQLVLGTLFRINFGRALGSLVYLRYLSVRDTNLLIFPPIQKLVLLQTLRLDIDLIFNIYFPPRLSRYILGKLGRLRHLYLPRSIDHSFNRNLKLRFNGLSKLETLENFDNRWCEIKDLPKLINIRKLRLQVTGSYYDVEEMMEYLSCIACSSSSSLQCLALSLYIFGPRVENGLNILRKLLWDYKSNLHELELSGKLPELGQLFEQQQVPNTHFNVSVIRISILTLWQSRLEEDPMPILEKIPTLCDLSLWKETYMGKEMVCSASGFPELTRLLIEGLPNLEKWRVEEGCMPLLSRLVIIKCHKLEELPAGLIFLSSLQALDLQEMPSEFCNRVRVVNGEPGADFHKVAHVRNFYVD